MADQFVVVVLQRDIDRANAARKKGGAYFRSCFNCPIAQALKRRKMSHGGVSSHCRIQGENYSSTDRIDRFMYQFDMNVPVNPGRFVFRRILDGTDQ